MLISQRTIWKTSFVYDIRVPSRWVLATPRSISQGIAEYYAVAAQADDGDQEAKAESVEETTKKSSSKPKPEKKVKTPKPSKGRHELSPDELKEKKQLAFIFCGWAFCGAILIDQFILKNYVFPQTWPWNFVLATISVPFIAFYLWSGMWKK